MVWTVVSDVRYEALCVYLSGCRFLTRIVYRVIIPYNYNTTAPTILYGVTVSSGQSRYEKARRLDAGQWLSGVKANANYVCREA